MATAEALDLDRSSDDLPIPGLDGQHEFVNGRLQEKPLMGIEANLVTLELLHRLMAHARPDRLGIVLGMESGFQIFPHEPRRVRYPDGAFIGAGRLGGAKPPRGLTKVVPDLVIEVISPNDLAENLDERLTDFLLAGVPLLWAVYPLTRHVQVYRGDGTGLRVGPDGTLEGEDAMPGFSARLADLFAVIDGDPAAGGGEGPQRPAGS